MEFIIKTDLNTLPANIDFNFAQLKDELKSNLEYYNGLVVTEDSIKDAKSDKAKLNKLKDAIEGKRKEIKKACLAPYEEFEKKVKELTSLIDAPVLAIDKQVKAFDELEKGKKRKNIEDHYAENVGVLKELLPLSKMWDERWLNVTFKLEEAFVVITSTIAKVTNDLSVIRSMNLECEAVVTDAYLKTLDLSKALEEKSRYEAQQKRLKELEEARKISVYKVEPPVTESFAEPEDEYIEPPKAEETKTISVTFHDTTEAFRADMKALTLKHNIKYGRAQ